MDSQFFGRRRRTRNRLLVLVGTFPLLTGLAACSSSSKASGSSPTTRASSSSSTPAVPTGTPINVGEVGPINSPALSWPFMPAAVKAAARGINARGGINGHPLVVHTCDSEVNPNVELQCAHNLVNDGVVAVLGGVNAVNGAADNAVYLQNHIAQIGMYPDAQQDFSSPNAFPMDSGPFAQYGGLVLNLAAQGIKKAWFVGDNVGAASQRAIAIVKLAAQAAGVTVEGTSLAPLTGANFAPYIQQAVSAGAQALITASDTADTAAIILAVTQAGAKLNVASLDHAPAKDLQAACGSGGGVCVGSYSADGFLPATDSSNAGIKLFQQDMAAEAASGDTAAAPDEAYNNLAEQGWLATEAFAKVAAGLTTITPQTVLQAMQTAQNINLWGVIPNWTPGKSAGIPGYSQISNASVYYTKLGSNLEGQIEGDGTPHNLLTLIPQLAQNQAGITP